MNMKKIFIKKIDVISVAKPLFLVSVVISLLMGVGLSLIMLPVGVRESASVEGVIVTGVSSSVPGVGGAMLRVMGAMFINFMGIYVAIIIGVIVFNIICRYTGGVGIEIESNTE